MKGKAAKSNARRARTWKARLGLAAAAIVVVALAIGLRALRNDDAAQAQQTSTSRAPSANSLRERSTAAPTARRATLPSVNSGEKKLQVVATVNGQQIDRQQLARECVRRFGEEVLQSMVNRELIRQACKKRGITVTDEQVEQEIGAMAKRFSLDRQRWFQLLKEERDIDPDQYRREIVWPTLALRRLAAEESTVTQDELRKAMESEFGAKVQVRVISTRTRETAQELHAMVKAEPDSFAAVAKERSEDSTSAANRGLIPPVRKHVGDPQVEQVVFRLSKGEVSDILHAQNQYLIFKCERHFAAQQVPPQNRRAIEARLVQRLRDSKIRESAGKTFKALQDSAKIVNVLSDEKLRQQMPGVAATVNGQPISMLTLYERCIAHHGVDVLELEIHRMLLAQALRNRNLKVTDEMLDTEIVRAAESYNVERPDGSADVDKWLARIQKEEGLSLDLYIYDVVWPSVALKLLVGDTVEITNDDLQKSFQSNFGERVRVLAIVLDSQRAAQTVWDDARRNQSEEFFGKLAAQYSVEPVSAHNNGLVPPIRLHGGQPMIEKEAFSLKPGELSGIVSSGDKFVIMKCLGRTKPDVKDIADVRSELVKDIREKKLRQAMAQRFDELKLAAQIDNFLSGRTKSPHNGKGPTASDIVRPPSAPSGPIPRTATGPASTRR